MGGFFNSKGERIMKKERAQEIGKAELDRVQQDLGRSRRDKEDDHVPSVRGWGSTKDL